MEQNTHARKPDFCFCSFLTSMLATSSSLTGGGFLRIGDVAGDGLLCDARLSPKPRLKGVGFIGAALRHGLRLRVRR